MHLVDTARRSGEACAPHWPAEMPRRRARGGPASLAEAHAHTSNDSNDAPGEPRRARACVACRMQPQPAARLVPGGASPVCVVEEKMLWAMAVGDTIYYLRDESADGHGRFGRTASLVALAK